MHFVLIHGAWHGGWCWEEVGPLLEGLGYDVIAPDLPGMGSDQASLEGDVMSRWVDDITDRIRQLEGRVMLVGHSRGGVVITAVAERIPEKLYALVYLTAILTRPGQSALDVAMELGVGADIPVVMEQTTGTCTIVREQASAVFYNILDEAQASRHINRLCPDPIQPMMFPIETTAGRFGLVPKYFIKAEFDRAIPLEKQEKMIEYYPGLIAMSLPSDHSPFFSMPERLVEALIQITQSVSSNRIARSTSWRQC